MLVVKLLQEFFIFCLMVLATVDFLHYPFKMADAQVKRWKTAKKDDDRKTITRKSSWSTKKSAP